MESGILIEFWFYGCKGRCGHFGMFVWICWHWLQYLLTRIVKISVCADKKCVYCNKMVVSFSVYYFSSLRTHWIFSDKGLKFLKKRFWGVFFSHLSMGVAALCNCRWTYITYCSILLSSQKNNGDVAKIIHKVIFILQVTIKYLYNHLTIPLCAFSWFYYMYLKTLFCIFTVNLGDRWEIFSPCWSYLTKHLRRQDLDIFKIFNR